MNDTKLQDVVTAYKASRDYLALAPSTRLNTDKALTKVSHMLHRPVRRVTRSVLLGLMDEMTAGTAYVFGTRMRALLSFAVEREMIEANPLSGAAMPKSGEYRAVSAAELLALTGDDVDPQVRMAVGLAFFTAQRISDVLKMRWSDIVHGAIHVRQKKTKMELFIPVHPALAKSLASHPRDGEFIISMNGSGYNIDSFRKKFSRERTRLGLAKDVHFHGLRKTAASVLASRGATTDQIKAVGGWVTTKQVDGYTKGADQFALAKGAIARL